MLRHRAITSLCIGTIAIGGCAVTPQNGGGSSDLRTLLMETRRDVEDLKRDQDRLRGQVEQLQYSASTRPPVPTPSPVPLASAGSAYPSSVAAPGDVAPVATPPAPTAPLPAAVASAPQPTGSTPPAPGAAPQAPTGAPTPMSDPIIAAVHGAGGGPTPGDVPVNEQPSVPTELRGSGYDDAVRSFVEEQYDDAIQYFRDFIHGNSTSSYADDAQYWIGESYLRKGVYQNAIKEFNQVVLRYGSGDRSAPALLKLAKIFSKIGDQVDARLSLQKLVNRYPGSAEATEATRLLQQMGG